MPPGSAHCPQSRLRMAQNCKMGLKTQSIKFSQKSFESVNSYNCVRWSNCFLLSTTFHLVTIGSAAWLGPQRPSTPLPRSPVRPLGFRGTPLAVVYCPSKLTRLTLPSKEFHFGLKLGSPAMTWTTNKWRSTQILFIIYWCEDRRMACWLSLVSCVLVGCILRSLWPKQLNYLERPASIFLWRGKSHLCT